MIFVNYKTYESGTGEKALSMSKMIEEVSQTSGVKIIPVVQALDIKEITSNVSIEVWSQKIDPVTPESVLEDGAIGTFLNHSENRFIDFETLSTAHDRTKEIGLKTLIFAKDIEELEKISSLRPDFISYEPLELIGSKDVSVATAKPEVISYAATISKNAGIPLIVGAGIHSSQDVKKCLELGAIGVAVASDIMNAVDPKKELLDLVEGFQ
ncbi:MAG: triose-phosphate isomerase [Candidatus Woesebacteria bacterium]|nr:triose-phosphate isomerase [Candidatus Woesebacteria bacterium]